MKEFLGFGLTRPFQRDGGDRLRRRRRGAARPKRRRTDPRHHRLLRLTQGELPWRTDFGSLLHVLRHQRNDAVLQELARVYVVDALQRWEPRVAVTSVQLTRELRDGENVLAIRLRYNVISTNTPGNNVILSGVEQTVLQSSYGNSLTDRNSSTKNAQK
jgi:phage baseplate assembly protein W